MQLPQAPGHAIHGRASLGHFHTQGLSSLLQLPQLKSTKQIKLLIDFILKKRKNSWDSFIYLFINYHDLVICAYRVLMGFVCGAGRDVG